MTINAFQRFRSKSIADVFTTATEIEDDQEDLLPGKNSGKIGSTLAKWRSTLTVNFHKNGDNVLQPPKKSRSRANSIFTRPPTHPHPRRQSLAEIFRRPVGLKEDIKKIWERRPSITGLKDHLKMSKSNENMTNSGTPYRCQTAKNPIDGDEEEEGPITLPSFFLVDRSVWRM